MRRFASRPLITITDYSLIDYPWPIYLIRLSCAAWNLPTALWFHPCASIRAQTDSPHDWHFVHLGSRAVGRAAAVIAEATAITADSRISPQDLGIWTDAHIEPLRRVFSFIAEQGSVPGIQLAHAGRKASTNQPWNGGKPITPARGRMDADFCAQRAGIFRWLPGSAGSHSGGDRF